MATRSKYRAVPVVIDGKRFASGREGKRYLDLRMLERAGVISHLECQPRFPIVIDGEALRYSKSKRVVTAVMDFAYFRDGKRILEDSKGYDNPLSKLKRALVERIYRCTVEVV